MRKGIFMFKKFLKSIFFIIIFLFTTEKALTFEEYLATIQKEKKIHSSIPGIDFVYVINLKKRPEKWQKCLNHLIQKDIEAQRIEAVDGSLLNLDMVASLTPNLNPSYIKKGKPGFFDQNLKWTKYDQKKIKKLESANQKFVYSKMNTKGHLGAAFSHLTILKDAIDSGYENILVLEDDFQIEGSTNTIGLLIQEANQSLGAANWDIIFLDNWHALEKEGIVELRKKPYLYPNLETIDMKEKSKVESLTERLNSIQSRYGLYSMVLSKRGVQKLYSYFKANKMLYPIDAEINNIPGIVLLEVKNHLITCDRSISDTINQ